MEHALLEQQPIGRDGEGSGDLAQDFCGRLGRAGLIAFDLLDVDADGTGQALLRQGTRLAQEMSRADKLIEANSMESNAIAVRLRIAAP